MTAHDSNHHRGPPRAGAVSHEGDLPALLREWDLVRRSPVVVLVGGADGLEPEWSARCDLLLREGVVPVLDDLDAVLVDGGTDSGIIALAGHARHATSGRWALVGVVAAGTVRPAGSLAAPESALLESELIESHHSHVIAVPGSSWGDEAPWLGQVAAAIAGGAPTVTVLANGGDVAYEDVRLSLRASRGVLVLSGTGRAADEISRAREGRDVDPRAVQVAASALLTVVPFDPERLRVELRRVLGS